MSRGCEQHGLHATSLEAEQCARQELTGAEIDRVVTGDRVRVTFDGVAVLVDEHGVHEVAVYDDLSGVIQLEASRVTVTKLPAEGLDCLRCDPPQLVPPGGMKAHMDAVHRAPPTPDPDDGDLDPLYPG